MTTHRNHYVPQWYQKRFLKDSQKRLWYLDLSPERTAKPTGERVGPPDLQQNSPKYCFWSEDLYTTDFFGTPNDAIERLLFGTIDNDGANAVRAVIAGDLSNIHDLFQRFFEYLDAQKLRTPKGLDWIRQQYPRLNQAELMLEMQQLRQMHCTMWLEAVREVVSAEESDVKFIVTDHPVTIYHPQCPPDSDRCAYPNDPDIALKGAQTLFPLGPNHCLILTNLEYAQSPSRADLLDPRQNARHFGRTLARVDAWIRTRKLSRSDVIAINHILKSRARRFIAAAAEEWLYPEKAVSGDWASNGKMLLPAKELWRFGGEIYIGYKDGTSAYQDAFGQTSPSHEYLRKEPPENDADPNVNCGCGSGRPYQACCRDIPLEDRAPFDVYSIRERNLMFCNAVEDIIGLRGGKSWVDVRRELSDEQVKKIHEIYAALWPKDSEIANLLPRPDQRVFRALYVGLIDPRTIALSVIGWLRYFDEILLLNPFPNPAFMRPEYSPIDSPAQYKDQTLKNAVLLIALAPLIRTGAVHLVPDPMEFNDTFREVIWKFASERMKNYRPGDADRKFARQLGRDDLKRVIGRLPDDDLRHQIRLSSPDLNEEQLQDAIRGIREEHATDPFALLQPLPPRAEDGPLQGFRSTNFELAMFLAQLTGAAIYTDQQVTKGDLADARNPNATTTQDGGSDHMLRLQLTIDANPEETSKVRNSETSKVLRTAIRGLWQAALSELDSSKKVAVSEALRQIERMMVDGSSHSDSDEEAADGKLETSLNIDTEVIIPPNGYGLNSVRRFLIAFGRRRHITSVPLAILFGRAV